MTLRVAVQMDPLETIKIGGDSSFALMLAAQARGHVLYHYDVKTLAYDTAHGAGGRLTCWAAPVTVQRVEGNHFTRGEYRLLDLVEDVDVVLMRQDPPFDLGYITATHLLERLAGQTLVVNDPASVRNAPEKVFVLDFARFMPPTFIARRIEDVRAFNQRHPGDLVIKPLHGNGGKAVFRVPADGSNLGALIEMFENAWVEPFMVQPFLPDVAEGDKRIVLVDGEFAGAINRKPGEGEFRSNLAVGGSAEACGLTSAEEEICAALGPELKARGLVFVGIDVIGGKWLTEINVTSPTGIVAIDRFNGTDTGARIWDAIERRHAAM
ncbi:glutathione synthase [Novosphingobium panipatense]|jgi:glutathione synthase|uniref:Glutathione synthetase n=1 Tax=Novosphingobium panipatense TaxID=428991 RepID=A0ABY1Q485_9SPHN|nr:MULTISPECIES: glutathione synthase [Novosphingobium]SMP57851.1 glutathione synthase [Novosphingobium panipatense]